jgi:CheY-like chemotaxis protein
MQQLSYPIEGESETAELARLKDWAATPLGPVEDWPQSLRTSLSICLACRFPIILIWGPQMVVLYNDAFIPVLGNKHPASMGGPGREVWADVWHVVGPMLESVLHSGKAVKADDLPLLMRRNGYEEETYFSFSYSPVADETGGVGGIFTPVIETTDKVIGHRRIERLRLLGSQPRADNLQDACATLAAALAGAAEDIPFGMIYAIGHGGHEARLAASFGFDAFPGSAPRVIGVGGQDAWQVIDAARTREQRLVEGLAPLASNLPRGAWGAPVERVMTIPVTVPGQDTAVAVLVAAVSPHRALDDAYRSFYKLLGDQLQGSIGAALSYEAERKRALALADLAPEQIADGARRPVSSQVQAYITEAEMWLGAPRQCAAPEHGAARGTVFVVDDNHDMLDYVAGLLAPLHAVRTFADGQQALAAARRAKPALIVSDVMMPAMGGYELLAALKADPALAKVPVLLLSARAGEEARISAARAGTDDYLEKPFSSRELLAKVDALLLRGRVRDTEAAQWERMAGVFHQAPAAIAVMSGPRHVFELANPLYQELVGKRELLHKPVREALPELASTGTCELLDAVYASGEPYVGHALRADLVRGDPPALQECYFDFVYQPMFDCEGRVEGITAVVFEVTATVQAKRAAEQASRAKDEFMAILGHELRNPLAPIITALEVMKLRGIGQVEREHAIIERQSQHLVGLVDDLLDVARVARGKLDLRRELCELSELVAAAVETVSPLLEERKHLLHMDVPRLGLAVEADRQRISQAVANLLTNAAKYSARGSDVFVRGRRIGAEVVIEVRDTGRGIAGELLPHLFEMFYQDSQSLSRSRGGLGLGLTIVRSLVELHGGSVAAASAGPGKGSTFTLRLPAAEPVPQPVPAPGSPGAARREEGLATILLVDDNVDAAETLRELLQALGYTAHTAYDGPSALRKLDEHWPDIAILDIGLPGMDGYELAARIRQAGRPIRLAALSGYGQESDSRRALAAGFDSHLTKPVSLANLQTVIGKLVTKARAGAD